MSLLGMNVMKHRPGLCVSCKKTMQRRDTMPEELLLSSASEELLLDRRIIPWHLGGGMPQTKKT